MKERDFTLEVESEEEDGASLCVSLCLAWVGCV